MSDLTKKEQGTLLLKSMLYYKADVDIAKFFLFITKKKFLCRDLSNYEIMYLNEGATLYERIGLTELGKIVFEELTDKLEEILNKFINMRDGEQIRSCMKLRKDIRNIKKIHSVAKAVCMCIYNPKIKNILD